MVITTHASVSWNFREHKKTLNLRIFVQVPRIKRTVKSKFEKGNRSISRNGGNIESLRPRTANQWKRSRERALGSGIRCCITIW